MVSAAHLVIRRRGPKAGPAPVRRRAAGPEGRHPRMARPPSAWSRVARSPWTCRTVVAGSSACSTPTPPCLVRARCWRSATSRGLRAPFPMPFSIETHLRGPAACRVVGAATPGRRIGRQGVEQCPNRPVAWFGGGHREEVRQPGAGGRGLQDSHGIGDSRTNVGLNTRMVRSCPMSTSHLRPRSHDAGLEIHAQGGRRI
jgi:hypothetical protein